MSRRVALDGIAPAILLFGSLLALSQVALAQDRPHPWCGVMKGGMVGEKGIAREWAGLFFGELARKFDLKGYEMQTTPDAAALIESLQSNERDFAIVSRETIAQFGNKNPSTADKGSAETSLPDRLRLIGRCCDAPSGDANGVAVADDDYLMVFSPKAWEMAYPVRADLEAAAVRSAAEVRGSQGAVISRADEAR